MIFKTKLNPGDVINNTQLKKEFVCSTLGGMRRSAKTNTMVLVGDHTNELYTDEWKDGVLNYTGMGITEGKRIDKRDKVLAESFMNSICIHLFEVFTKGEFTYKGEVKLASATFKGTKTNGNGEVIPAWIFPLEIVEYEEEVKAG